jgi:hypothetical protein
MTLTSSDSHSKDVVNNDPLSGEGYSRCEYPCQISMQRVSMVMTPFDRQ